MFRRVPSQINILSRHRDGYSSVIAFCLCLLFWINIVQVN